MKKIILLPFFLLFFCINLCSQTINDTQILPSNHWIYESLYTLGREQKITAFYENTMLSVGELKFYLSEIEYEKLSMSGKKLYDKVNDFLYADSNILTKIPFINDNAFKFGTNLIVNPEFYYKSNTDIDWSFKYKFDDNFITAPMIFGLSNYITIEADPFIGKSNIGASDPYNFMNIPYKDDDPEFLFMRFAYGSTGITFEDWGVNFNVAKEGLSIGNTHTGSIFYNSTFETDVYTQLNLFSRTFKYSADVVQECYEKYLYVHQIELRPFKPFKVTVLEGFQINGPFELRYLNPFMFMHQLSSWNEYDVDEVYGEENFCAYFGIMWDWNIVKNTRFYGIFSQNEIQMPPERNSSREGDLYPDSIALQLGTDVSIPSKYDGYWNFNFEAVYTSPYMYCKHTPQASLYRVRDDNLSSDLIKSWVGTPFGPDTIACQIGFGYDDIEKWKAGFAYIFAMKGEHDFSMFDSTATYNGKEYYDYFPRVSGVIHSYDEALADAHNMLPSGVPQFTNQIALNGQYKLNGNFEFKGQILYSFVFNNKHEKNNFDQGIEFAVSAKYKLLK